MQDIRITVNESQDEFIPVSFPSMKSGIVIEDGDTRLRVQQPTIDGVPSLDDYIAFVRTLVSTATELDVRKLNVYADSLSDALRFGEALSDYELGRHFAENVFLSAYAFTEFKTPKEGVTHDLWINVDNNDSSLEFARGVRDGTIVGKNTSLMRDLTNTPPNILGPEEFVNRIRRVIEPLREAVDVHVLSDDEVKQQGMNLLHAVGQGSAQGARLVLLEYVPEGGSPPCDVLIGKGVTFDTGGMNLKPSDSLTGMEKDMSGAAAVLAAFCAAVELNVKRNIIAVLPLVENAIGARAVHTTSTVKSLSGLTVTIGNTDAEGRLILADAITYAARNYEVRRMMTVATLTGASIIAIGQFASGIFCEDPSREAELRSIGDKAGDYVWPLPPWSCYDEGITKDPVSDLNNVQKGRYGGATIGYRFLMQFVNKEKVPNFAHLDMAPRMEAIPSDNVGVGASGDPVRFLVRYLQSPFL